MIDKKSRRVVIINNIQSDTIDQAIFILKSDKGDRIASKCSPNIATEAQQIIDNYIQQVERLKVQNINHYPVKKRRRFVFKKWHGVFLFAVALLYVCIRFAR